MSEIFHSCMCKRLRGAGVPDETLENLILAQENRQNRRTFLVIIGSALN